MTSFHTCLVLLDYAPTLFPVISLPTVGSQNPPFTIVYKRSLTLATPSPEVSFSPPRGPLENFLTSTHTYSHVNTHI